MPEETKETKSFRRPRANPLPQRNMPMFRQPAYREGVGISSRSIKIYFSILFIALIGVIGFLWWRGML
ncbi:MAG: hypothetical protein ACI8V5_004720 [Limisphaerales bacterium]|jgi:hypothetical protein